MNVATTVDWRDQIFEVFQDHDIKQVYHVPDAGHSRVVKVMVEKLDFIMPPQDGAHLKDRFRAALLGSA
jgi:hypothetical protein